MANVKHNVLMPEVLGKEDAIRLPVTKCMTEISKNIENMDALRRGCNEIASNCVKLVGANPELIELIKDPSQGGQGKLSLELELDFCLIVQNLRCRVVPSRQAW